VSQFLEGKAISAMDHLQYSPELAPANIWLFPELKRALKVKSFLDAEDIKLFAKEI
jgi:hypothetical protein